MVTMGAPAVRRTTKITLDPITIEGKAPSKAGFDWRKLPWKWIIAAAVIGGGYYLLRKKGRRPLAAA